MDNKKRINRHHFYLEGWYVFEILHALEKVGVGDVLRAKKEVSVTDLAEQLEIDERLLRETLVRLEVLDRSVLTISEDGVVRAGDSFFERFFQNQLFFTAAYRDVLNTIDRKLLKSDMTSPVDAKYLGRSSEIHNGVFSKDLTEILQKPEVKCVVDLGCGNGHLLREISTQNNELTLLGVDAHLTEVDAGDIQFVEGSYEDPIAWQHLLADFKGEEIVFVMVTSLHEIVDDKEKLSAFFKEYKRLFPGSSFIILEHTNYTKEELQTLPESEQSPRSLYLYIHTLTDQGVPKKATEWQKILKEIEAPPSSTVFLNEHIFLLTIPMVR